jgi:hypothetical protein
VKNWDGKFAPNELKDLVWQWEKTKEPIAVPHKIKQAHLKKFAGPTLIETGTYHGDMVASMLPYFKEIQSIEINSNLYNKAKKRFQNNPNITLHEGNSNNILPKINLEKNCVFWLDGHYCFQEQPNETPILEELEIILTSKGTHCILIDDARFFTGKNGYPTIQTVTELVAKKNPNYTTKIEDDILKILPISQKTKKPD